MVTDLYVVHHERCHRSSKKSFFSPHHHFVYLHNFHIVMVHEAVVKPDLHTCEIWSPISPML